MIPTVALLSLAWMASGMLAGLILKRRGLVERVQWFWALVGPVGLIAVVRRRRR